MSREKCLPALSWASVVCGTACLIFGQSNAFADPSTRISRYAGNGRAGLADGPAGSAEFILPSALATDSQGDLYVADAAAQRIRVIRSGGSVKTLAGSGQLASGGLWVAPGFKDGPALQAQFNRPSGVAVGASGHVYVADTHNHCIRLVSGGIVSTYAGICGTAGTKDGPRAEATFWYPHQLSFDAKGNLYVADFGNGVRKIDPLGLVTTLPLQIDKRVTGVQSDVDGSVWIADVKGLLLYNLQTAAAKRIPAQDDSYGRPEQTAGNLPLGSPYALAESKSTEGAFYTDLRSDSVRRLVLHKYGPPFVTYLSGVPREDAVLGNGWITSSLHGPMGIAFDSHGRLFVADSGHKRILQITGFDRERGLVSNPLDLLKLRQKSSEYRILVIGNSFVWFTSEWRDSIGALLEKDLRDDSAFRSSGLTPTVVSTVGGGGPGQASFAKQIISQSSFDFVLILANSYDLWGFEGTMLGGEQLPDANMARLFHKEEADTVAALNAASMKSMFVVIPDQTQVTPLEILYSQNLYATEYDYASMEPILLKQLEGIGAPILNLFPLVRAYEGGPFMQPLYNNEDLHPSSAGRAFIAKHIAERLEQLKPWNRTHK